MARLLLIAVFYVYSVCSFDRKVKENFSVQGFNDLNPEEKEKVKKAVVTFYESDKKSKRIQEKIFDIFAINISTYHINSILGLFRKKHRQIVKTVKVVPNEQKDKMVKLYAQYKSIGKVAFEMGYSTKTCVRYINYDYMKQYKFNQLDIPGQENESWYHFISKAVLSPKKIERALKNKEERHAEIAERLKTHEERLKHYDS